MSEQNDPEIMGADTAFLVFIQDGNAFATNELGTIEMKLDGKTVEIVPSRKATPDDLYRYSLEVAKDVQVTQTVEGVVNMTLQISQQIAQQQEAQRIAQATGVGGGLKIPGQR